MDDSDSLSPSDAEDFMSLSLMDLLEDIDDPTSLIEDLTDDEDERELDNISKSLEDEFPDYFKSTQDGMHDAGSESSNADFARRKEFEDKMMTYLARKKKTGDYLKGVDNEKKEIELRTAEFSNNVDEDDTARKRLEERMMAYLARKKKTFEHSKPPIDCDRHENVDFVDETEEDATRRNLFEEKMLTYFTLKKKSVKSDVKSDVTFEKADDENECRSRFEEKIVGYLARKKKILEDLKNFPDCDKGEIKSEFIKDKFDYDIPECDEETDSDHGSSDGERIKEDNQEHSEKFDLDTRDEKRHFSRRLKKDATVMRPVDEKRMKKKSSNLETVENEVDKICSNTEPATKSKRQSVGLHNIFNSTPMIHVTPGQSNYKQNVRRKIGQNISEQVKKLSNKKREANFRFTSGYGQTNICNSAEKKSIGLQGQLGISIKHGIATYKTKIASTQRQLTEKSITGVREKNLFNYFAGRTSNQIIVDNVEIPSVVRENERNKLPPSNHAIINSPGKEKNADKDSHAEMFDARSVHKFNVTDHSFPPLERNVTIEAPLIVGKESEENLFKLPDGNTSYCVSTVTSFTHSMLMQDENVSEIDTFGPCNEMSTKGNNSLLPASKIPHFVRKTKTAKQAMSQMKKTEIEASVAPTYCIVNEKDWMTYLPNSMDHSYCKLRLDRNNAGNVQGTSEIEKPRLKGAVHDTASLIEEEETVGNSMDTSESTMTALNEKNSKLDADRRKQLLACILRRRKKTDGCKDEQGKKEHYTELQKTFDEKVNFSEHLNVMVEGSDRRKEEARQMLFEGKMKAFLERKGTAPFHCHICKSNFTAKSSLNRHYRIHTGEKPFRCKECGNTFTAKHSLVAHSRIHSGKKPYICIVCGSRFRTKPRLIEHFRRHRDERPYACPKCPKSFKLKNTLTGHIRTHSTEKRFSCKLCGKTFRQNFGLNKHMRIHRSRKPFLCLQCGKCFISLPALKSHFVIHIGERPFCCELCGRSFARKRALHSHLETVHRTEMTFQCSECGKTFQSKSSLNIHSIIHRGSKPYTQLLSPTTLESHSDSFFAKKQFSCSQCDKQFTYKSALETHLILHSGETSHSCPVCQKNFMFQSTYDAHLQSHKTDISLI